MGAHKSVSPIPIADLRVAKEIHAVERLQYNRGWPCRLLTEYEQTCRPPIVARDCCQIVSDFLDAAEFGEWYDKSDLLFLILSDARIYRVGVEFVASDPIEC